MGGESKGDTSAEASGVISGFSGKASGVRVTSAEGIISVDVPDVAAATVGDMLSETGSFAMTDMEGITRLIASKKLSNRLRILSPLLYAYSCYGFLLLIIVSIIHFLYPVLNIFENFPVRRNQTCHKAQDNRLTAKQNQRTAQNQ